MRLPARCKQGQPYHPGGDEPSHRSVFQSADVSFASDARATSGACTKEAFVSSAKVRSLPSMIPVDALTMWYKLASRIWATAVLQVHRRDEVSQTTPECTYNQARF